MTSLFCAFEGARLPPLREALLLTCHPNPALADEGPPTGIPCHPEQSEGPAFPVLRTTGPCPSRQLESETRKFLPFSFWSGFSRQAKALRRVPAAETDLLQWWHPRPMRAPPLQVPVIPATPHSRSPASLPRSEPPPPAPPAPPPWPSPGRHACRSPPTRCHPDAVQRCGTLPAAACC